MGSFDIRNDSPSLLKKEALDITLKFDRTGPTTGRISWNIPTPAAGCTADTQTYCGIVVTLDTSPATIGDTIPPPSGAPSYLSPSTTGPSAPVNGTTYIGDPTGDPNLNTGSKIGTKLVVGAFYNDRATTFVDVTDLQPTTTYYVAGYPHDCVNNYYTQGVYAYSLNYNPNPSKPDVNGFQVVELNSSGTEVLSPTGQLEFIGPGGVKATDSTGLVPNSVYQFSMVIDGSEQIIPTDPEDLNLFSARIIGTSYTVSINGSDAQTYGDMVNALNIAFQKLQNPPVSPTSPNTGTLYWDSVNQKLYKWDGNTNILQVVTVSSVQPNTPVLNSYWYNTATKVLNQWNGSAWIVQTNIINYLRDPTKPTCDDYWFDGTTAYLWNGTTWCKQILFNQTVDPSLPVAPACGTYWFNESTQHLYSWNVDPWVATNAIIWNTDPNTLTSGFWFDENNNKLYQRNTPNPGWNNVAVIISTTQPVAPALNAYWFDPDTELLSQWNGTIFVNVTVIVWPTDPTTRSSCDLWWNSPVEFINPAVAGTAITAGYQTVNISGSKVGSSSTGLENNTTVYTTSVTVDGGAPIVINIQGFLAQTYTELLAAINAALSTHATATLSVGLITITSSTIGTTSSISIVDTNLFSTLNNDLRVWSLTNNAWEPVANFIISSVDPASAPILTAGELWYNPSTSTITKWDGSAWVPINVINHSTDPTIPVVNEVWFNTITSMWNVWNGSAWVPFTPVNSATDPTMPAIGSFWFNTLTNTLNQWNGVAWISLLYVTVSPEPATGTLWFDSINKVLKTWNGTTWVVALPLATAALNTDGNLIISSTTLGHKSAIFLTDITLFKSLPKTILQDPIFGADGVSGQPSYLEVGVGTTGTPEQRLLIMNEVRTLIGYPTVKVELTNDQLEFCVNNALENLRRNSMNAYKSGYFFLYTVPGKQSYYLTNEGLSFNKIVSVMGVYRMVSAFLSTVQGAGAYGQIVLQHLYNMGTFDILSYFMVSNYISQLEQVFAARLTFTWNEQTRVLFFPHTFARTELLAIDSTVERTEEDIFSDRWNKNWLLNYATANAYSMLAQIRGKYGSLPGAGGGVVLNAAECSTRSKELYDKCQQELDDFVVNNVEELGIGTTFTWG